MEKGSLESETQQDANFVNSGFMAGLEESEFQSILDAIKEQESKYKYYIFGQYEQDGNADNGAEDIEWIILEETNDSMLLISRYILDYVPFNDTVIAESTDWSRSTLRNWLNNKFYNSAFSYEEQQRIMEIQVQDYHSDNMLGKISYDKVFILSKKQAFEYFEYDFERATVSTTYANKRTMFPEDSYWLINSHSSDLYKCVINSDGRNENNPRVNEDEGIRPVIVIQTQVK